MSDAIASLEKQIRELTEKLNELRRLKPATEVRNYAFSALGAETDLLRLFGKLDRLLVIHNMGQGCRYCTLWGDGFNGFLPHLESIMSVVLVSKDPPEVQRKFANDRGWRFNLASHDGGDYLHDQGLSDDFDNMPGAVVYERVGDTIYRKNTCVFGPGDLYCSMWGLLALAGISEEQWTPQYNYWRRPEKLEDGGGDLRE